MELGRFTDLSDTSKVCDVVRCAFVFRDMEYMLMTLHLIFGCDKHFRQHVQQNHGWDSNAASILELDNEVNLTNRVRVLRVKNRFSNPTEGGWADCMVNLSFVDDDGQHICEIQLVHEFLMCIRKNMGAHQNYGLFRSAQEGLEAAAKLPAANTDTDNDTV